MSSEPDSPVVRFLSNSIFGLVAGLLLSYLGMAGITGMAAARIVLVMAWVLGIIALSLSEWLRAGYRRRVGIVVSTAIITAVLGFLLDSWATKENARLEGEKRTQAIADYKKTLPDPMLVALRMESFGLSEELTKFADDKERQITGWYRDRFKGMTKMSQFDTVQSMTDEEVERGFVQWQAAAREYQDRFGPRVQAILGRIKTMTGKPVEVILLKSDLVADSRTFKVKEVATDITNLAGTLP